MAKVLEKSKYNGAVKAAFKNVDRGIKWLDENVKGWRKKIDVAALDLKDGSVCVMGQLFGDYMENLSDYKSTEFLADKSDSEQEKWADQHGFHTDENVYGYDLLTMCWFSRLTCGRI